MSPQRKFVFTIPEGFHLMTPLKSEASWSSVHGLVKSTGGALGAAAVVGVSEAAGVSMSMALSSWAGVAAAGVAGVATLLRPLFLGGIELRI